MLRITPNSSAGGAKSYYTESLSRGDYYSQGQEIVGRWGGKGAERIGLHGTVDKHAFDALCDNRNPTTGKSLTARTKSHRRVGYDFNFHAPKSVSVIHALTGDARILDAFQKAVADTMRELEQDAAVRVRKGGSDGQRTTGELVWAEFTHFTARPVDGIPDPHLHSHNFVFNATWDQVEGIWKAAQLGDVKRDASYYEAAFHARFAGSLAAEGYAVERTKKGWEISGVPASVIQKYSRRTLEIEELAQKKGITSVEEKARLGAQSRAHKREDLTIPELRELWALRLDTRERAALDRAARADAAPPLTPPVTPKAALDFAAAHAYERASVVSEKTLMATALRQGVGNVSVEDIHREVRRDDVLTKEVEGQRLTTTRAVLHEERELLAFCREGRGTCRPLVPRDALEFRRDDLTTGQQNAVRHVVHSYDRVVALRGAAGTGKTTLMQEAADAIKAQGKGVFVFAPSAEAGRGVLRKEGFDEANTVASLLQDERLHPRLQGQVVWLDEAGQLGTRTLKQVTDLAEKYDFRLVLSGDSKQHAGVERGDALRLLETQSGVPVVEVTEIKRQRGAYKEAIAAFSRGDVDTGLARLDAIGSVQEIPDDSRHRRLAADYLHAVAAHKSALIVSPTHREGEAVTAEIRAGLKAKGLLAEGDRPTLRLTSYSLTEAMRSDPLNYRPGDVVVFLQNVPGFQRGERATVIEPDQQGLIRVVRESGSPAPLPLSQAARFQVYEASTLPLAAGDTVRITQNGFTADKRHRLNNGALYAVEAIDKNGDLLLKNGWTIDREFGHLAHGYVTTSHASQGKTVDRVFIAQSSESAGAASREQIYVSASRAKERCTIYTDDKDALLAAVRRSGVRMAATELAAVPAGETARPSAPPPRPRRDRVLEQIERLNRLATLAQAYASQKLDDIRREIGKIHERWRAPELQRGKER
jgi:conjugative relaxase-like TrwC/TraI family protein